MVIGIKGFKVNRFYLSTVMVVSAIFSLAGFSALAAEDKASGNTTAPQVQPPAETAKADATMADAGEPPQESELVQRRSSGKLAPTSQMSIARSPTEDEKQAFKDLGEDAELFQQRVAEFSGILEGIVKRTYEQRKKIIEGKYLRQIEIEEQMRNEARRKAIEYFERFLKKYPKDPPYTPDAMFRLAELYFEDSYVDYLGKVEIYMAAMEKYDQGKLPVAPEEPKKDYSKTIQLFEDLIVRYPHYRHVDGAYYLLGFCLAETGREPDSRLAWLNLVCANKFDYSKDRAKEASVSPEEEFSLKRPEMTLATGQKQAPAADSVYVDPYEGCEPVVESSKFFSETWLRIGEYHFDYDYKKWGLERAISAYSRLLKNPEDKYYDEALYKLAWTYYRSDKYPDAIHHFSMLVDFSDARKEQTGKVGSQMRPEAIQYLSICFSEEDWNDDQVPDTQKGIERIQDPNLMPQDRPWTREVYQQLGQIYFDQVKYPQAIEVWELTLKKFPLAPEAPKIQQLIATAYQRNHLDQDEIAARSKLADYGRDSEWWKANEDHPEIQRESEQLAEDALYEMAIHHHQVAMNQRQAGVAGQDPAMLERAIGEYNMAAKAYKEYLERYPNRPDAYELNYNLADAYYYSGQISEAIVEYAKVRDSNLDDRYREECGYKYIKALEEIIEKQTKEGRLEVREKAPEPAGEPPKVEPIPFPDLVSKLMEGREIYVRQNPKSKNAGPLKYQNALLYYFYGDWVEAKKRFQSIYEKYCDQSEIGGYAWSTMVNMAGALNQLDEAERLAKLQSERQCAAGTEDQKQKAGKDAVEILQTAQFRHAMDKFKEADEKQSDALYEEAADMLVAAVEQNATHPEAALALNNAAVAYERVKRFDSATKLYEKIVNEYPKSSFVDRALFRMAFNAFKVFEFEKAVESYRILADDARFKESKNREDAVLNTAVILTYLQRYDEAVVYWKRYSEIGTDKKLVVEAAFRAGSINEDTKRWSKLIQEMNAFIKRFGTNREAGPYLIHAYYLIYKAHKEQREYKAISNSLRDVVAAYGRYNIQPGSNEAEYAAEAHFLLIEDRLKDFEGFKIKGGDAKAMTKGRDEGALKVKELEDEYGKIKDYRRPTWSVAAQYRIGYAYEIFAKAILSIPLPALPPELAKQLKRLPQADRDMVMQQYEDQITAVKENLVRPMEERAVKEYELTMELSKKGNIANQWTQEALQRLNAYKPEQYSLQLPGRYRASRDDITTHQLDTETKEVSP